LGLAADEGSVSFAGTDLAFGWRTWFEGAPESGARGAASVLPEVLEEVITGVDDVGGRPDDE
jgi:monoamine oxidase